MAKADKTTAAKPKAKNAAEKVAIASETKKRAAPRVKKTDGAAERIFAIINGYKDPILRTEITTRMGAWERSARDAGFAELLKKKKILSTVSRTGGRGRPGELFRVA